MNSIRFCVCMLALLYFSACTSSAVQKHTNSSTYHSDKQARVVSLFAEGRKTQRIALHDTAIDFFNQAIEVDETIPALYDARALSYEATGNDTAALADFNQALMLDAAYLPAYVNRANLFMKQKQYQEAIGDYDRFLAKNTDEQENWQILHSRAIASAKLERYKKAIDDYSRVIALAPQHAVTYFNRGVSYAKSKQNKKAISDLQTFLRLVHDQADPLVLQARAVIFQLGGQPE